MTRRAHRRYLRQLHFAIREGLLSGNITKANALQLRVGPRTLNSKTWARVWSSLRWGK